MECLVTAPGLAGDNWALAEVSCLVIVANRSRAATSLAKASALSGVVGINMYVRRCLNITSLTSASILVPSPNLPDSEKSKKEGPARGCGPKGPGLLWSFHLQFQDKTETERLEADLANGLILATGS